MEWTDLTTTISLLSALGAAVLFILNIRQKKLQEKQKTRQEKNEADRGEIENFMKGFQFWKEEVEDLRKKREEQDKKIEEQDVKIENQNREIRDLKYRDSVKDRKIAGMQKYINKQSGQKKYAESRICDDLPCEDRTPKLGTYTTEDFDPKKLEQ